MNDYWPVQDLWGVNLQVETVHPTIPNLYTLLSLLPPNQLHYSILDLKDTFFAIPDLLLSANPSFLLSG